MAVVIPVATPVTRHHGITQTNVIAAEPVPSSGHHAADSQPQAGGTFRLRITTTPGRSYVVEGSTNLLPGSWVQVTNFTATGSLTTVTNTGALLQQPLRFYRARTP